MFITKGPSLRVLIRRLIFSFSLVLLGSWGLLFPRLDLSWGQAFFNDSHNKYYYDLACLSLLILGFFLVLYYRARLNPRLKRVDDLGEGKW